MGKDSVSRQRRSKDLKDEADSGLEKGVQAEGLGRIKPEGTEDEAGTVSC